MQLNNKKRENFIRPTQSMRNREDLHGCVFDINKTVYNMRVCIDCKLHQTTNLYNYEYYPCVIRCERQKKMYCSSLWFLYSAYLICHIE